MARGRCRGGGADHQSDVRYSHCLEFSENCLKCQGILFWWLGGNPAGSVERDDFIAVKLCAICSFDAVVVALICDKKSCFHVICSL